MNTEQPLQPGTADDAVNIDMNKSIQGHPLAGPCQ